MRMWMVKPELLCNQHLLGEHGEIHKHRHVFMSKHSISGRIKPVVQIEPRHMKQRHDALVREMLHRGMEHHSPYIQPDISYLKESERIAQVDVGNSYRELCTRCSECSQLITNTIIKEYHLALRSIRC